MGEDTAIYGQAGFGCRFEWGLRGARAAAERGDILIIVDVLSFTSAVTAAVEHGADIFPYPMHDGAEAFARQVGAELRTAESVPAGSRTLSPLLYGPSDAGKRYVVRSPNGATCARHARAAPALLAGCLRNAAAVAEAANRLRADTDAAVTVIASGEKWKNVREGENTLRPCIEDYLGAGAILASLDGDRSPEAELCAAAFRAVEGRVDALVWDSASGRELRAWQFEEDVRFCARLNVSTAVPRLAGDHFTTASA